jgi:hypothetical protein
MAAMLKINLRLQATVGVLTGQVDALPLQQSMRQRLTPRPWQQRQGMQIVSVLQRLPSLETRRRTRR